MPVLGYRSGTKIATAREEFIARARATGKLGYLMAPASDVDPLEDLSDYKRGTITQVGGAARSAAPLLEGGGSIFLDGTNDYLETGWLTRTNLVPNPSLEVSTSKWVLAASGWASSSIERSKLWAVDGEYSLRLQAVKDATATARSFEVYAPGTGTSGMPVTAANTYTLSYRANVIDTVSTLLQARIIWYNAAGAEISATAVSFSTAVGEKDVVHTAVSPALAAFAAVSMLGSTSVSGDTVDIRMDAIKFEAAAAAGTYFPSIGQLASGEAGWSGTANESASDIGPFARGTSRTFVSVHSRRGRLTTDIFIGGSGISEPGRTAFYLDAATEDVRFGANLGTVLKWTGAAAVPGVTQSLAASFNNVANTVDLVANSALVSQLAHAVDFGGIGTLQIGARASGTSPFEGSIAATAVFLGALTVDEMQELLETATRLIPDRKYLTRVKAPRGCRVPKVSARLDGNAEGGSDQQPLRAVIYDATKRLAVSEEVIVKAGDAVAWRDFEFPDAGGIPLAAGDYDLGLIAGAGAGSPCTRLGTIDGIGKRFTAKDAYGAVTTVTTSAITLPTATIPVTSTAAFDNSGVIYINGMEVNYVGKSGGVNLTNATGGSGVIPKGTIVEQRGASVLRAQPETPNEEVGEFAIFATSFEEATVPDVDDAQIARYPFSYAQSILGSIPPLEGSGRVASATWHGTRMNRERGSFVLVQQDGEFSDLIGQRVRISTFKGKAVYAYVLTEADLDEANDLSLTRRLFLALAPLATESLGVRVETLSTDGS